MVGFEKIMRHMSQWDNPDRSRDNPQRAGPENLIYMDGWLAVATNGVVALFEEISLFIANYNDQTISSTY